MFLTWEEVRPLLAYAPEDREWQAMVAMRDLLGDLYLKTPPRTDLRAADIARAYRLHCYMAACHSNYHCYLKEEVTMAVVDAAELAVGLDLVCVDVIDGLNDVIDGHSQAGL